MSYARAHNEANGEDNNDGHADNHSANWGAEGPTDDPAILDTRRRLQRALLATVFLAQGTPMVLSGDEFGRTQKGSNNAYCQDNEISWVDWKQAEGEDGRNLTRGSPPGSPMCGAATRCCERLASCMARTSWWTVFRDIAWFDVSGELVSNDSWNNPKERRLVLRLAGRNGDGAVSILTVFFNATGEPQLFRLPPPGRPARLLVDSSEPDAPERYLSSDDLMIGPRSVVRDLEQPQGSAPGSAIVTGFARDLPFGATLVDPGHSALSPVGPGQPEVAVDVDGLGIVPMTRAGEGWFEAEAACGAGARYRYRLADGLAVPDPASRAQGRDVHDPSLVVDPRAYRWRHAGGAAAAGRKPCSTSCMPAPSAASPAWPRCCRSWPSSASPRSS